MALCLNLDEISKDHIQDVMKNCVFKPTETIYNKNEIKDINCFAINGNEIYLPLGFVSRSKDNHWIELFNKSYNEHIKNSNFKYNKILYSKYTDPKNYRDQDIVKSKILIELKNNKVSFLSASTGFGKTTIGCSVASTLKLKTAILCHLDVVKKQWFDELKDFSNAKVQLVKGSDIDEDMDVYILGIEQASKISRDKLLDIGFVIIDEAHIATITAFSKTLLRFQPSYILGLSATPYRADGMQSILEMYFGNKFIVRKEVKPFTIYKTLTPFVPIIEKIKVSGTEVLDWNLIVNSLAYDKQRIKFIMDIIIKEQNHKILVLSNRNIECEILYDNLKKIGEDVTLLIGKTKVTQNHIESRIMVAGLKKAGVGFNDPSRTMLIMASDCKMVEQFEGRIRTINNVIYDLVDDFSTFEKHWNIRRKWYEQRGGTIKELWFKEKKEEKKKVVDFKIKLSK